MYKGDMKGDEKIGGVYTFKNGDVYTGEWKGTHKHGRGVYRFADGDIYEGDYDMGDMQGHGIFR